MHPNLSFEQAPPISVPFRFFLTAPLFGILAGLLLIWLGPDMLASRWSAGTLALTHLLSVGFLLQAMCGALLQFVPVTSGGNVWQPRLVAGVLHPLLIVATLLLAGGFALSQPLWLLIAASLFAVGLGSFLFVVGLALWRTPAQGPSIRILRLALFGLAVTLILGILLVSALGGFGRWQTGLPLPAIVNVHAAWGLGGWALMLVIGVSNQVVPMFQLTPPYPVWLMRWLPPILLLVLGLWTLQPVLIPAAADIMPKSLSGLLGLGGLLLGALYAAVTLQLQSRRRRRLTDVNFAFWRGAMLALLTLAVSWLTLLAVPALGGMPRAPLWLGVLAFVGVFMSAINGMLYKIVPFLNWLHLQQMAGLKVLPPNIKQMIPEARMREQFLLHFLALALLLAALFWPLLTRPAGAALAASCLWLEWNLIGAVRLYANFRKMQI
ncbi:MAG TPA: hypothetical protein PLI90_03360 [Rhodocyclaceae bacterium]|nr:hypothetical protein [Rhodocyclaceae bacterium]